MTMGACTLTGAAQAQQPVATLAAKDGDEEQELAQLMSVLQQETAVATKTRMNSDYVPGIVTVLDGDELEALGFRFVWDALAMVPGIQPVRGQSASPSTIVRGIQFPFNSGNVKLLVDGVPLSRQSSGVNSSVLFLPIEQVERIEVIRGPGSVVYGDFAFMGLINILTRKEGARAHLRGDDDGLLAAGGHAAIGTGDTPWQLSANLSTEHDSKLATAAPRTARGGEDAAIVNLRRGAFGLEGQLVDADRHDSSPLRTPGPPTTAHDRTWAVEARWDRELAKGLGIAIHGDYAGTNTSSGILHFEDRLGRGEADLTWDRWAHQSWLLGVESMSQEIRHATLTPGAPPGIPPPPATIVDGRHRNVSSLVLQDRFDLSDSWSLTAGARYDDYSDIGSRVTPRLSLVYRLSDHHIWKAQYAEGFRAPTFFEEYGGPGSRLNSNLDFEVNKTTELNYVYRRPQATGRATVYHSVLENMIFIAVPVFANTRHARANGVELEWSQQLASRLKVLANLSKAWTRDDRGPTRAEHESEANPDWMSDLALLMQASSHMLLAVHWNHVADRGVLRGDDAYDLLDVTASASDLFGKGIGLRLGVRNALDDTIRYVQVPPTGIVGADVYGERSYSAQLSWHG